MRISTHNFDVQFSVGDDDDIDQMDALVSALLYTLRASSPWICNTPVLLANLVGEFSIRGDFLHEAIQPSYSAFLDAANDFANQYDELIKKPIVQKGQGS